MYENELIKCPHCGKYCEYGFNVCQGCGAEIVYGATFNDMKGCGCLMVFVGIVIMIPIGISIHIVFTILPILFMLGFIFAIFLYRGVRFIRSYKHR